MANYNSKWGEAVWATDLWGSFILSTKRVYKKILNTSFHKLKINNYLYKRMITIFHKVGS